MNRTARIEPTSVPLAIAVFLLILPCPRSQQKAGAGAAPPTRANQTTAPAQGASPTLANFAWLEGRWQGDWGPRVAEQVWLAPKAGLMLGTFRVVEDDKTVVIELFTLIQKPDGIEFRFRHFTPELIAWEKSDSTLLTLESVDAKKAVFVNSAYGQPRRVVFTRIDQDTYVARSEVVPESGDLQVVEIIYHRQKPGSAGNTTTVRH